MKVKLIQSGGFAGIKKIAEAEISVLPQSVQQKLQILFAQPEESNKTKSPLRDKEQLHLELNGKVLDVDKLFFDKDLHDLVEKMKGQLHY